MLDLAESEGYASVVSWMPDRKSFMVHNVYAFVAVILPRFFKQSKYKSFQKQLNVWCFERICKGPYKGAYRHPSFEREQHGLCRQMQRKKVKGSCPPQQVQAIVPLGAPSSLTCPPAARVSSDSSVDSFDQQSYDSSLKRGQHGLCRQMQRKKVKGSGPPQQVQAIVPFGAPSSLTCPPAARVSSGSSVDSFDQQSYDSSLSDALSQFDSSIQSNDNEREWLSLSDHLHEGSLLQHYGCNAVDCSSAWGESDATGLGLLEDVILDDNFVSTFSSTNLNE